MIVAAVASLKCSPAVAAPHRAPGCGREMTQAMRAGCDFRRGGLRGLPHGAAAARGGRGVLGLDNFNHYYDVRLTALRARARRRAGMTTLFEGDVCDGELLELLLTPGR